MTCTQTPSDFPHCWTEGDQLPKILGVLKDTDGTPINISGYTLTFKMDRPKAYASLTKDVTITDAPNGAFEISWDADDLKEGLGQICHIVIDDGSGKDQTSPRFAINVEAKIT